MIVRYSDMGVRCSDYISSPPAYCRTHNFPIRAGDTHPTFLFCLHSYMRWRGVRCTLPQLLACRLYHAARGTLSSEQRSS